MKETLLNISIPVFLLAIAVEYYLSRRKKLNSFTFNNSISNLSIGVAERLSSMALTGIFYSVFAYIHDHYAILRIKENILSWTLLLIVTDFLWYWYHRLSHEVNVLWAAHIVHHQSEDFNFTVSARITIFQSLIRNVFWSILPLIGFPVNMVILILLVHAAYSFFTHTRVIGKLGFLEHILVTPSHHRVHHASNERYLDKNYADIFIIWDKLFGTFEEEKEEPVYGLTNQLTSKSFLWQHFHQILELLLSAYHAKGLKQKFMIFFGKPEILSPDARITLEQKFLSRKTDTNNQKKLIQKTYIVLQLVLCIAVLSALIPIFHNLDNIIFLQATSIILITLINCGAILEQKSWIFHLECLRFLAFFSVVSLHIQDPTIISVFINILLLLCFFYSDIRRMFLIFIYGKFFYSRMNRL